MGNENTMSKPKPDEYVDAALLTVTEQAVVDAARIVGVFPNRVPWVHVDALRFAAHMAHMMLAQEPKETR